MQEIHISHGNLAYPGNSENLGSPGNLENQRKSGNPGYTGNQGYPGHPGNPGDSALVLSAFCSFHSASLKVSGLLLPFLPKLYTLQSDQHFGQGFECLARLTSAQIEGFPAWMNANNKC